MNTTISNACGSREPQAEQTPARMVAGALAHLAKHMETGCQRSAYLAAMLLERVASDPEADDHLRRHARELVEILDRDGEHDSSASHETLPERRAGTQGSATEMLMGAF